MKILVLHNLEEVAKLLTEITMITEVEASSVPNLEKFKEYLDKYKFEAVYILDDFADEALELLIRHRNKSAAIGILLRSADNVTKFLRLGVAEINIETIPFNPLSFFVKVRALLKTIQYIKNALKQGINSFDFFRHGLFNLLNILTLTDKTLFVSVKDLEEEKILYSLKVRNGQVISCNQDLEKIVEINSDDTIPKSIEIGSVTFEDRYIFKDTAEFYKALLGLEMSTEEVVITAPEVKPQKVEFIKENPFRERRIYKFDYEGFTVYSQPYEGLRSFTGKEFFAVPLLDEKVLSNLQLLRVKNRNLKLIAPQIVKNRLKLYGFTENNFVNFEGVKTIDTPYLGSKFEGFIFFPNGISVSGNLFGSFVSKDVETLDRIFFSHLRIYHHSNISSNEKLKVALEKLKPFKDNIYYILPTYGYPIDQTLTGSVFEVLNSLSIPEGYRTLLEGWKDLSSAYGIEVETFDEFLKILEEKDGTLLFNLINDMEVLGIVPFEF